MAVLSCFLVGSAVILMGLAAYLFLRPKPPPFHVNYPPVVINAGFLGNIFPLFRFVMTLIPESMRKSLVVKMGAPKPDDKLRDRSAQSIHKSGDIAYLRTSGPPTRGQNYHYRYVHREMLFTIMSFENDFITD